MRGFNSNYENYKHDCFLNYTTLVFKNILMNMLLITVHTSNEHQLLQLFHQHFYIIYS